VQAQLDDRAGSADALVAVDRPAAPFFRALRTRVRAGDDGVVLPAAAAAALQVAAGEPVGVCLLSGEGG
jgi:arginine/ornithine N-succinyltransferase beta subunit